MISKIRSDPELKEELCRLNFGIRKSVVKITGDSYVVDEGTDTRIEPNQIAKELERIAYLARESGIRQYLFEMKAELKVGGITEGWQPNKLTDERRLRGICETKILCGVVPVHGRRQPAMMSHPPVSDRGVQKHKK